MNNPSKMNKYLASIAMIKQMINEGSVIEKDMPQINKYFSEKYGIKDGSLYSQNNLIKTPTRAMYVDERSKKNGWNNKNKFITNTSHFA